MHHLVKPFLLESIELLLGRLRGVLFFAKLVLLTSYVSSKLVELFSKPADARSRGDGEARRGVEISGDVADGDRSVILEQVTNGVAVRMAVLYLLAGEMEREATT